MKILYNKSQEISIKIKEFVNNIFMLFRELVEE